MALVRKGFALCLLADKTNPRVGIAAGLKQLILGHPVLCTGHRLLEKRKTITEPTELSNGHPIYRVDTLYFCNVKPPSCTETVTTEQLQP
jgi:hypothetical protein